MKTMKIFCMFFFLTTLTACGAERRGNRNEEAPDAGAKVDAKPAPDQEPLRKDGTMPTPDQEPLRKDGTVPQTDTGLPTPDQLVPDIQPPQADQGVPSTDAKPTPTCIPGGLVPLGQFYLYCVAGPGRPDSIPLTMFRQYDTACNEIPIPTSSLTMSFSAVYLKINISWDAVVIANAQQPPAGQEVVFIQYGNSATKVFTQTAVTIPGVPPGSPPGTLPGSGCTLFTP